MFRRLVNATERMSPFRAHECVLLNPTQGLRHWALLLLAFQALCIAIARYQQRNEIKMHSRGRLCHKVQYSTLTKNNPLAGAVGPASLRRRAVRISDIESALRLPLPTKRKVPTKLRTM